MRMSTRQWDVLAMMQADLATVRYHRSVGVMQDEHLTIAGQPVPRGTVTARALERKGLIRIDMRDHRSTAYPVHVSTAARDLLAARGA